MNRKLLAAVLAFLAAIVVLQPAVSNLQPRIDGLATDLARDGFDPFSPPDDLPDANPDNPLRANPDFQPPGSLLGEGGGDFTPRPGAFGDRWSMDRSDAVGDVTVQLVCDPALGAMKRLKAYDGLEADYDLVVEDPTLREPRPNPDLRYDQRFTCTFPVELRAGEPVPVYSPHPQALVERVSTTPPVEDLRVRVDGAGTYHLVASETREVTVNITYRADTTYWFGQVPASLHLEDVPPERRPHLPRELQGKADPVLQAMNLTGETNLRRILQTMQAYFLDFGEGPIPDEGEYRDKYHAIALGENGCCRHRAFAFHVTATSLGIPTRVVANEAHAYVEAWVPTTGWLQFNLGGCGSYDTEGDRGQDRFVDDATDPTRDPPPEDPPAETVATTTTLTRTPDTIRKGEPFTVEGRVATVNGTGVGNVAVDVFLNETKTTPGHLAGRNRTAPDGSFRVTGQVPSDASAGSYQLVAHGHRHRVGDTLYRGSWSDPPVEVTSSTSLTYLGPHQPGVGVDTSLRARLTEPGGTPVEGATVTLQVEDGARREATTDGDGVARWNVTFPTTGPRVLHLEFPGDDHRDPSSATARVDVQNVGLQAPDTTLLVRGEAWTLPGRVLFGGEPRSGQEVEVWVLGLDWTRFHGWNGTDQAAPVCWSKGYQPDRDRTCPGIEMRSNATGHLGLHLTVPPDLAPGAYPGNITLPNRVTTPMTFHVKARPVLHLDAPHDARPGTPLEVTLTLRDDRGHPLPGKEVTLQVHGGNGTATLPATTGPAGTATVQVPPHLVAHGDLRLQARYAGGNTHLAAASERTVDVSVPLWERVPVQALLGVLLAGTVAVGGNRALRAAGVDPRRLLSSAWLKATFRERPVLRVRLPGIDDELPDVWGAGDPLPVVVEAAHPHRKGSHIPLRDRSLRLHVDDHPVELTTDGGGTARHEVHVDAPRTVTLTAVLPAQPEERLVEATRRRVVRFVDYREEVEAQYEALKNHAAEAGLPVDDATTPRELHALLRSAGAPRDLVEEAVSRFEVTDFSPRDVTRSDYVAFHRAAQGIRDALAEGGDEDAA